MIHNRFLGSVTVTDTNSEHERSGPEQALLPLKNAEGLIKGCC